MKTILLVDDHEIVRTGLRYLLADFYPAAQLLEAKDGNEAIALLKTEPVTTVILDVKLPDTSSFELIEYIKSHHPAISVLVFSMGPENLYAFRFIKAGANGYLSKEAPIEEVKKAVEAVIKGKRYISPEVMNILVDEVSGEPAGNPFSQLSNREFAITSLLLSGAPTSEIGHQLNLQPSTVTTYKSRIFGKLRVSNLIELKELATIYNFP
jgi:two-component system, NarL family, invasion response regulator UvrY